MSKEIVYAIDIKSVVSNALLGIVLGAILTFIPVSSLVNVIIVIIGLFVIISNGINLYIKFNNKEESSNEMLIDAIGVLAGFLLLCVGGKAITIIVSLYFLTEPIILMALSKFDKSVAIRELPKITLGVSLLVTVLGAFDALFRVVGIIILIASLLYLGFNYYLYKKSGVKIIK